MPASSSHLANGFKSLSTAERTAALRGSLIDSPWCGWKAHRQSARLCVAMPRGSKLLKIGASTHRDSDLPAYFVLRAYVLGLRGSAAYDIHDTRCVMYITRRKRALDNQRWADRCETATKKLAFTEPRVEPQLGYWSQRRR